MIDLAVAFVERLPRVFGLIGENVISSKAGEVALQRSEVLTAEQALLVEDHLAAAVGAPPPRRDDTGPPPF